jgi:hypothetical protein
MLVGCTVAMFVYLGGSVGSQLVSQYAGSARSADQAMVSALLLNIALILLIWRRTTTLSGEVDVYRQAEVRAKHLAITDPLTNLFNRRAIKEKTSELSARASRRGKSIAVMTLTALKRSTIFMATTAATNCCARLPTGCATPCRRRVFSHGWAAMNLASAWCSNPNFPKPSTAWPKI